MTDAGGYVYQYLFYSPFGESLYAQHAQTGEYNTPHRFNAKELDPEMGNYNYGARYYTCPERLCRFGNPRVSIWLSVDPILKHHESPYAAFSNNPIMLIDPDGRDTAFADNQARQDFKAAQNTVNSKVSHYQQRVDENKALANQKGFGASLKRFFRNEKTDAQNLADWQKLESDFNRIVDPNTKKVEYSSTGVRTGASGTTKDMGKYISVKAMAGKLDTYIHENRHVNQIYDGTTGYSSNTDWYDELEAFQYQMIFNPTNVNQMIRNSALNHGKNPDFFTLGI